MVTPNPEIYVRDDVGVVHFVDPETEAFVM